MSGTNTTPNLSLRASNQSMPGNGAKAMPIFPDFSTSANVTIDLTLPQQRGQIDNIQAIWIDNNSASPFTLRFASSLQTLRVGPYSQGWVPAIVPNPPVMELTASVGADVQIIVFNVPMPYSVNSTLSEAPREPTTLISRSTLTVAASTPLMAANPDRSYLFIKAPENDNLWINPTGGTASIDGLDCIKIPQGIAYESGQSPWSQAITYYCATAGEVLTAFEA